MRALFLTHRLPYPPNRGDRIRAYHLLRAMSRTMDVDVLSLVHSAEEKHEAGRLLEFAARVETAMVPRGRNLVRAMLALPGRLPLTHVLLDSPAVQQSVARMLAATPPDLVVAYCSGMAQYALLPPLAGIPFVLDMVDVDSAKWAALGATTRFPIGAIYRREAKRLRAFEAKGTAAAVFTTVVNNRERVELQSISPNSRILAISNGIEVQTFRPPDGPSARANVVFCGVFNYEPNERGAVWLGKEVWPRVRRKCPDATLTLVGMNPTRRVRALASDPSIEVTGTVADVRPYLWRAALSAAPLFVARGLQNKVLEAVAAGLPCVITNQVLDGLPPSVRPACETASTAEGFAEAIVALLNASPAERRVRAGQAKLDSLSWEAQLAPAIALLPGAAQKSRGFRR